MPDISQITLPTGTTYDIKDATARSSIVGANIWYGTCPTAEATAAKVVTTSTADFPLIAGNILVVKFTYSNSSTSATLAVDGKTAKNVKMYGTTAPVSKTWAAGGVCAFVYDGDYFVMLEGSLASTSAYGLTKLTDSTTSTSTTTAATPNSVKSALAAAMSYTDEAIIGNASFQGVVNAGTTISGLTRYKKGWYWVVGTAGTYAGVTCEIGDFIFCVSDYGSAYSASDFKVVQANIDMSIFGTLAYQDSVSASYTPAGTVSQPTFTGTQATISVSGTIANSVTLDSQASSATGAADVTPAGTVSQPTFTGTAGSVSVSGTIANSVTLASQASSGTGVADVTPAGTVSQPTFSGTAKYIKANTTTVNSITDVGSLPSCTLPSFTTSVSGENLTLGWSAGSFSAGSLPTKGSNTTVATGVVTTSSATGAIDITPAGTVSQPTFSGTANYVKATVGTASKTMTGTFTPAGTVSQPTFSGTANYVKAVVGTASKTMTGTYTPAGTVSQPTFTGTAATITSD